MDRYLLFLSWESSADTGGQSAAGLSAASEVYNLIKENCLSTKTNENTFPACTAAGSPGQRKWFFATQGICGAFQFANPVWEELSMCNEEEDSEDTVPTSVEECLAAIQSLNEEESVMRDASQTELFEESAESIHLLSDQLPAPGRALLDVVVLSLDKDAPKLKDVLAAVGALKHLTEWHSAKITIAATDTKGWQKIADYLLASIVPTDALKTIIDFKEVWRGKIQIYERKFGSDIKFPEFCLRSSFKNNFSTLQEHGCLFAKGAKHSKKLNKLPEVFHYYSPVLQFVQMVTVSELPQYFITELEFELNLTRNRLKEKSRLLLEQLSSLREKVGALFILHCNVSSIYLPSANQLSTKKWKEYMARKPKIINVPDVDLKGETCTYYFLIQRNDSGACKAALVNSANQINGAAALTLVHGYLKEKQEEKHKQEKTGYNETDMITSVPCFNGDYILQREKQLVHAQASALKEFLRRQETTKNPPSVSVINLKALLSLTREQFLALYHDPATKTALDIKIEKPNTDQIPAELDRTKANPLEWPERYVLQNLENFEKIKHRMRVAILTGSSEQLLGRKDSQRESMTQLDAKELLKYFTPQGLPSGELQPLQVQRGYCLDNRRALERDLGFVELQSRLIRYETQTTCTRECCPIPCVLSPMPSPAVLSEPGSVPDVESAQSDVRADRLKRRSKDLDGLFPNKRLSKSESTESLVSLASGSSGHHYPTVPSRHRSERSVSSNLGQPSSIQSQKSTINDSQTSKRKAAELETSKQAKESRSQKHTRMLKEVVAQTLKKHGIGDDHKCFAACCQRLFEISKFYLKDLKTSRGLFDEMKKTANSNAKQVIHWELEKMNKKR
ncbi:mdm2-binding protein isoform X2 [Ambystoma mexicanum]|uniref:mdm2-binding protein isoform X2 n=1 Tax=Ambystoma mexicanum TaxID=8296 RepID=UPI0037E9AC26